MAGKSVKCKKCQTTFMIGGKTPQQQQIQPRAPRPAAAPPAPAPRPKRPPVQVEVEDEEAAVVDEDRPRRQAGGVHFVPQSNVALVGICCGACFLLFGLPMLLVMSPWSSGRATVSIQMPGGGSFEFNQDAFKDAFKGMPQGMPKNPLQGVDVQEMQRKMQEEMQKALQKGGFVGKQR